MKDKRLLDRSQFLIAGAALGLSACAGGAKGLLPSSSSSVGSNGAAALEAARTSVTTDSTVVAGEGVSVVYSASASQVFYGSQVVFTNTLVNGAVEVAYYQGESESVPTPAPPPTATPVPTPTPYRTPVPVRTPNPCLQTAGRDMACPRQLTTTAFAQPNSNMEFLRATKRGTGAFFRDNESVMLVSAASAGGLNMYMRIKGGGSVSWAFLNDGTMLKSFGGFKDGKVRTFKVNPSGFTTNGGASQRIVLSERRASDGTVFAAGPNGKPVMEPYLGAGCPAGTPSSVIACVTNPPATWIYAPPTQTSTPPPNPTGGGGGPIATPSPDKMAEFVQCMTAAPFVGPLANQLSNWAKFEAAIANFIWDRLAALGILELVPGVDAVEDAVIGGIELVAAAWGVVLTLAEATALANAAINCAKLLTGN